MSTNLETLAPKQLNPAIIDEKIGCVENLTQFWGTVQKASNYRRLFRWNQQQGYRLGFRLFKIKMA